MRASLAFGVAAYAFFVFAAVGEDVPCEYRGGQLRVVDTWLGSNFDDLVATCKHIHANPELSLHEEKTAALVAKELRGAGYEVTEKVGGYGVVGVLINGDGPTVLVRGDMDGLPVVEESGLDYASKVKVTNPGGQIVGVMHACGHDIHTSVLIGTAKALIANRDSWRGTVVMVAQPAEELGVGAIAMINDGLFKRFPKPDICLSLHVSHQLPAGTVGYTAGWAAANVDSVDITVFGRGGHGARPNSTVDPIVTAAHIITQLQTLVSRRVNPIEPAVVTVGSIHGGAKHNVIPNEIKMQLTVRSYTDEVRDQLLVGIKQIATDVCRSFQCPKPPTVLVQDNFTPACFNDPVLALPAADVLRRVLGDDKVIEQPAQMGGEDFGAFARSANVPGLQYSLGSISQSDYDKSVKPGADPLPSLHSSRYRADAKPTLRTGVRTMATLTMSLLSAP